MNKHIELVKKWLDDSSSVTKEELRANCYAANAIFNAASDALSGAAVNADNWVKEYEKLSKSN